MALKQRVRIGNSPGTLDAGYRNEIGVILFNNGSEPLVVNDSDRIAQLVIVPCWLGDFEVVDTLPETQRNQGGFGSTGV
jgi:dUTP pyrophosphatase